MFASIELAARIERAECRLLTDGASAIARRRPEAGVIVTELCGGVAVRVGAGSPLTKVAGLGFAGPLDEAGLAEVERSFAAEGLAVQIELATLADPAFARALGERGYVLHGFENVLGRALPAEIAAAPSDVAVSVADPHDVDAWIEVVATGFASPDTQGVPSHESYPLEVVAPIMRDFATADGVTVYVAHRGGVAVGGASMRTFEGVAHLCGSATLPAHRRRGVQTALLARRLGDAARAGCDVAVVVTMPGSKSQQNVQRLGFALLYSRAVLVRAA